MSLTILQCLRNYHQLNKLTRDTKIFRNNEVFTRGKATKTASSVYNTMNIFDRQSKTLQKERSACREDYHLAEYIKDEIGWRTADRVFDIKRTFQNGVELGASRGYVSRHLGVGNVLKMTLVDSSATHLSNVKVGEGIEYTKIVMDEENFDFPESSIDLFISSLALHWVNDLPGCFDRVMKCLKPDGVFLACMFGGDTLMELRQSIQLAENERLGGMFQHTSPFTRVQDIGGLLNSAGFTLQTVDTETLTVWYPSAFEVMKDVRLMGESNAALTRPLRLGKDIQFAAAAIYDEMYGKEVPKERGRGVPASFEIVNFVGWKPDPSQPKPMARGTGEISMKDLHKIDKIIEERQEKT